MLGDVIKFCIITPKSPRKQILAREMSLKPLNILSVSVQKKPTKTQQSTSIFGS